MLSEFRSAKVVVIDDIAANLRLLESSLRACGLRQVQGFTDSAAGLQWLQSNPWDLLLLDLDMPQPSGFEILKALAGRDRMRQPVIIVTALGDPGYPALQPWPAGDGGELIAGPGRHRNHHRQGCGQPGDPVSGEKQRPTPDSHQGQRLSR